MHNQSPFVKIVIWIMVFLMSVGFAALVVTPFLQGNSLFGDSTGEGATLELRDEARADVRKDECTETDPRPTGKRAGRCREALLTLASAYQTLAYTPEDADSQELPKDAQRNLDRSLDAYKAAYLIDPKDEDAAKAYAGALRDQGKAKQSIPIWTALMKSDPDNADYLLQLGAAHEGAGDTSRAIATYQSFIKKFPDSGQVETVKEQIKTLEDQAKQSAEGGAAGGTAPITVG